MRSLENRLRIGLTISLVLLIGVAWWLGHAALHHTAHAFVVSRLEHDAEGLLRGLERKLRRPQRRASFGLTPVYQQPYSGHYFVIDFKLGERLRSDSLGDMDLAVPDLEPGQTRVWEMPGPIDQRLTAWAGGYRIGACELVVAVAEDITPLSAELVFFERLFAFMACVGLALSLLTQRLILRRTFASLTPVYRDIERLERGQTTGLTEQVPGEILPLVRKLNRLLALLTQRLERSRTAAGNLSHAIKGPLSLLRQQLQDPSTPLDSRTRTVMLEQVERLRQIAERQLKRARLAGAGGAGVLFDPAAELPILARLLERMHSAKTLEIRLEHATEGALDLDREDMLELLGNLLDNACKWAHTRVHGEIFITGETLVFRIDDDGTGCDPDALAAITERGVRLDEQVSGHGLGLAIVKEVVEGYGGTLGFGVAPMLGGLRAEAHLPLHGCPVESG